MMRGKYCDPILIPNSLSFIDKDWLHASCAWVYHVVSPGFVINKHSTCEVLDEKYNY